MSQHMLPQTIKTFLALLFCMLLLAACNIKNDDKELAMNQAGVIEVVIYHTKVGVKDVDHIKKASAITPILASFSGFLSRQFSKSTDGKWIDIVYWKDLSSAKKAAEDAKTIPECQKFFDEIDYQKMEFMHSTILHHYP